MVWEDVVAFRAVCEELHFTRAARRLHMSQPTLTMRIKRLERQVGARLLHRTSRSVRMTPAGETLFVWAREAEFSWSDVQRRIRASTHVGDRNRWALGASGVDVGELLPLGTAGAPTSVGFTTYPTTALAMAALRAHTIDIAVFVRCGPDAAEDDAGVRVDATDPHRLWVYFPSAHPAAASAVVDLAPFADHDWIMVDPWPDAALHRICRDGAGFVPHVRHRVDDARLALRLVAEHHSVMLGPPSTAEAPGVAGRPFHTAPEASFAVATLVDGPTALHRAVLAACQRHVARLLAVEERFLPAPRIPLEIS